MSDTNTRANQAVENALYIAEQSTDPVAYTIDLADTVVAGIYAVKTFAAQQKSNVVDDITATTIEVILASLVETYPVEFKQAVEQLMTTIQGTAQ